MRTVIIGAGIGFAIYMIALVVFNKDWRP